MIRGFPDLPPIWAAGAALLCLNGKQLGQGAINYINYLLMDIIL
jgi:hypothetical protein